MFRALEKFYKEKGFGRNRPRDMEDTMVYSYALTLSHFLYKKDRRLVKALPEPNIHSASKYSYGSVRWERVGYPISRNVPSVYKYLVLRYYFKPEEYGPEDNSILAGFRWNTKNDIVIIPNSLDFENIYKCLLWFTEYNTFDSSLYSLKRQIEKLK
jgi:hypothetical protein